MTELWRVIPDGDNRPADHIWTTREALDRSIEEWGRIMFDKRQPDSIRSGARRLEGGTIQLAAYVEWIDSE